MRDLIAFVSILIFAGFADGLMDKSPALFLIAGVLVLGTAGVLVCARPGRDR